MKIDVGRLPRHRLGRGQHLFRIHRAEHEPWFFSAGAGRFDPCGQAGHGSCYLAEDPLGAWIETFRSMVLLTRPELNQRVLSTLTLDRDADLIDLTARHALAAGATAAITVGADHSQSQELARTAQEAEIHGIRWRLRHDLGQRLVGVCLFGPQGAHGRREWGRWATRPLPADVVRDAQAQFGYLVSAP